MSDKDAEERGEDEVASDLVARIQAGDSAAEGEFFARYQRGVLYLLRRLGASPEQAEDLQQDVFRIVLERLRSRGLDEPAGLAGFVRGTARNLLIAERRKAGRRRTEADPDALAEAVDGAPSPLSDLVASEDTLLVRRLVQELANDRDREILYRFYIVEDDKDVICADLGLSSQHFNRVLHRARQRFKELLEAAKKKGGGGSGSSSLPAILWFIATVLWLKGEILR